MDLQQPNFRSIYYCVAQLSVTCRSCGAATRVVALVLPPGHELLDAQEEPHSRWQVVQANALIFDIARLPGRVQERLREFAPGFSRYDNHCEHCGVLLDEYELHCEPGDSFVPMTQAQGSRIRLTEIQEPFAASAAGYSLDPQFVPFARRA